MTYRNIDTRYGLVHAEHSNHHGIHTESITRNRQQSQRAMFVVCAAFERRVGVFVWENVYIAIYNNRVKCRVVVIYFVRICYTSTPSTNHSVNM